MSQNLPLVIASEAKQSRAERAAALDCFVGFASSQ